MFFALGWLIPMVLSWVFTYLYCKLDTDFLDFEIGSLIGLISLVPVLNIVLCLFMIVGYYHDSKKEKNKSYEKLNQFYTCKHCDDLPYRLGRIYEHSYALMKEKPVCPGCEHGISVAEYNRASTSIETDVMYSEKYSPKEAHKLAVLLQDNKYRFQKNGLDRKFQQVQERIRPERLKRMEDEIEKLRQQCLDSVNEDAQPK